MCMTKDDWNAVQRGLQSWGAQEHLMVDGYVLTIRREALSEMRDTLCVYVNGRFQGKWLLEDCEERRRFLRPISKPLLRGKVREHIAKSSRNRRLSAEYRERMKQQLEGKWITYSLHWLSFNALRRHLVKHNKEIRRLDRGEANAKMLAKQAEEVGLKAEAVE